MSSSIHQQSLLLLWRCWTHCQRMSKILFLCHEGQGRTAKGKSNKSEGTSAEDSKKIESSGLRAVLIPTMQLQRSASMLLLLLNQMPYFFLLLLLFCPTCYFQSTSRLLFYTLLCQSPI